MSWCSFCEFTYQPCPIHDPEGYDRHEAESLIEAARWWRHHGRVVSVQVRFPRWVGVVRARTEARSSADR